MDAEVLGAGWRGVAPRSEVTAWGVSGSDGAGSSHSILATLGEECDRRKLFPRLILDAMIGGPGRRLANAVLVEGSVVGQWGGWGG